MEDRVGRVNQKRSEMMQENLVNKMWGSQVDTPFKTILNFIFVKDCMVYL